MTGFLQNAITAAKSIQIDADRVLGPPEEGLRATKHTVIMASLVRGTRGYIEKIANQANGAYENGWYDAASVMIRRLLETLIIETFEAHGIATKIQDTSGNFLYLRDLINKLIGESTWNLSRNAKSALPRLKDLGDKSAHSRYFTALRGDIDPLLPDIRTIVQELLYLSKLK